MDFNRFTKDFLKEKHEDHMMNAYLKTYQILLRQEFMIVDQIRSIGAEHNLQKDLLTI